MIAFLTGRIAEKGLSYCILDVHGVGYRMTMSTSSLSALPAEGDGVTVLTCMHVRGDEVSLFGFENAEEKALFEQLITVSGVGPKVALAALSSYAPASLVEAIAREDVAVVSSVSGIGKKTAQRIILELKDKLGVPDLAATPAGVAADSAVEVRDVLVAMGFSAVEATTALRSYDGAPDDTNGLLKHALRRLGGGS
ncbi:MAG: Holliday junction branch migration protein RuvA [Coriobacteriia bacterium]|nr:Holliday junction branch migration protein RuvA [Coriobacteriia bacterium]